MSSAFRAALALVLVLGSRAYIPRPAYDWLHLVPAGAALYLLACVIAPRRLLGDVAFVARRLDPPKDARPWGSFLLAPWFRSSLLLPMLVLVAEMLLRCGSYHRALVYERHGDLLFTPVPRQEAIEKISLTPSWINELGLRGALPPEGLDAKKVVLCLGDSITYGYGVDDGHAYPAALQRDLDARHPGGYAVLNGGVNAYPMSFVHQKFLYLWNQGVHPAVVIVGYSMNEGWLGHLVGSDAATKDSFERRVWLKNLARSFALYNLVVENWGIAYYEAVKESLIPGTHTTTWSEQNYDAEYDALLERMVADFRARGVQPIFVTMAAMNGKTGTFDTTGFLQEQFAKVAAHLEIPVLRTDEVFRAAGGSIDGYFRDRCHMSPTGNATLAATLAPIVERLAPVAPRGTAP